jgi:hypothetical protein
MSTGELHCGEGLYEAPVTIDLKEAGLKHSSYSRDHGCGGRHKVEASAVTIDLGTAGLVPVEDLADLGKVLQNLHQQAHPDGTQFWQACREPGCAEAAELWEWS